MFRCRVKTVDKLGEHIFGEVEWHCKAYTIMICVDVLLHHGRMNYSQFRLISLRLIEHSRIVIDFLGTGRHITRFFNWSELTNQITRNFKWLRMV